MITVRDSDKEGRIGALAETLPATEISESYSTSGVVSRYERYKVHRDERACVAYTAPTLVFVTAGGGKALERQYGRWRETQMRLESIALFPADYEHGCQPGGNSGFVALTLGEQRCPANDLDEMSLHRLRGLSPLLGRHDAVVAYLIGALDAALATDAGNANRLMLESIGHAILQRLLQIAGPCGSTDEFKSRCGGRSRVQKAVALLRDDPGANVGIDQLATLCAFSASHFVRCFKTATGLSPSEYQRRARIEMATRLLRNDDMALQDIAVAVGFDSVQGLRKAYEKIVGAPIRRRQS